MSIKKILMIFIVTTVFAVPTLKVKEQNRIIHFEKLASVQREEQASKLKLEALENKKRLDAEAEAKKQAEALAAQQAAEAQEVEKKRVAEAEAKKSQQSASIQGSGGGCGVQDPKFIYSVLTSSGVPRDSAIQQIGSWKTESGLDPCQQRGDGGKAWGLNSWHPNRRRGMPMEAKAQILWAVHTEMKRDCASCYQQFMAGGSTGEIRSAIKRSTRWGVQGARWSYADQFASVL